MARALGDGSNQGLKIDSQDAVEAAVLDLIGDLAAYRPHAKIVLVEGHRETRFDVDMIRRLFPDFAERGNFIPVGNRRTTTGVGVRLLEVLEETGLTGRAVTICDGDLGLGQAEPGNGQFLWPVYEIENFLLDPPILRGAAQMLLREDPFDSDEGVLERLRVLADELVPSLALVHVQYLLNEQFVGSLGIGGSPKDPVRDLTDSAASSQAGVAAIDVSEARIQELFDAAAERLKGSIASDEFIERFPGDRLIRAFAGGLGISGEHFRNACLDQAVRMGARPAQMEETLARLRLKPTRV